MADTVLNCKLPDTLLERYFHSLVNRFFKILPMRENNEETIQVYLIGLQHELLGCRSFIPEIGENPWFLSLLSILQYLIDSPECPIKDVRREVFGAISMCNKMVYTYSKEVRQ